MKRMMNISLVLLIALLFTGCAGDMLPDEDTEKTEITETKEKAEITEEAEQPADSEMQGEVTEAYSAEEDEDEKYNDPKQQDPAEDKETVTVTLSEEELARLRSAAEKYYTSIYRNMLSFTQADPASSFIQEYEGYGADEVVLFEVSVENSENKRYITIGSKDGWNNCSILNEGY